MLSPLLSDLRCTQMIRITVHVLITRIFVACCYVNDKPVESVKSLILVSCSAHMDDADDICHRRVLLSVKSIMSCVILTTCILPLMTNYSGHVALVFKVVNYGV